MSSPFVLDVPGLRERLLHPGGPASSVYGDDGAEREAAARGPAAVVAAVLVPVITHEEGLTVLFTRRNARLRSHSGQVSFPGGRAEPDDAGAESTALRETEEEIGLPRSRVEVLGCLPDYLTRTGYRVTPVVGLVAPPLELVPDAREVDEVFEVPLEFLLDPSNHRRESREIAGRSVGYYVMEHQGRVIWGATAGMVVNLYQRLCVP
jgi:8-oxo-dGTP pyrophosphatase MutT (NUDIX family)